ncbi:EAL domain-containing protein [Synechococcus sp. CS-1328]|uniref:EAL domain-containing protein n=1 Tax=Synechococcus sp. CS-1328 TaxID=2847976 RepID=UPI00223C4B30|nr:EAL domain-containing protein [Synechococcus sp. CS-1328]MCT0225079.1 EAL domain-containing protein [Synechococcus sp. CS-1328]
MRNRTLPDIGRIRAGRQDELPRSDALQHLLDHQELDTVFQPILSLRHQSVVGIEALARPRTMGLVQMFLEAETTGRMLEVDRLCRWMALETYRRLRFEPGCRPLLFLNFEASVIDRGVLGSGWLLEAVQAAGLEPGDVVIEVNESRVLDLEALRAFVDDYRQHGFLIALDDLGAGDSNLPRIAQLRPHIIKLDRHLVAHVDRDFFKQETIKSLVNLSRSIGCMVLAEGVETHAEVDTCASLGAELLQGFFFARPRKPDQLDLPGLLEPLAEATRRQRVHATRALKARRQQSLDLHRIAQKGCASLQKVQRQGFDQALRDLLSADQGIEATYLLDERGIQVSETHMAPGINVMSSRLFEPARRGSDHSFKEYFFSLADTGLTRYTTNSYISLATGHSCRTVAVLLRHGLTAANYVLCIDFLTPTSLFPQG